jgi:DNA-binding ferritin-like protein
VNKQAGICNHPPTRYLKSRGQCHLARLYFQSLTASTALQRNSVRLNGVLEEMFRLYVQIHGYRWNLKGRNFRQLHAPFKDQYQDLWLALDMVAERCRTQGVYAPALIAYLMALAGPEDTIAQFAAAIFSKLIKGTRRCARPWAMASPWALGRGILCPWACGSIGLNGMKRAVNVDGLHLLNP